MANEAQEAEMGDKMVSALNNLANAAVQQNDTFEQHIKSNTTFTEPNHAKQGDEQGGQTWNQNWKK